MHSTFASLGLAPELLRVVAELGFTAPTPIQSSSIPELLSGRDLLGQSKTGSGKTAAFALPFLQRLDVADRVLQVLVLCPTRELCAQVAREVRKLGRGRPGLAVLELVGGQPSRPQREALERGVHIAVGTPGRLLDHLSREALDTTAIQTVVLDEADRMLDMGFGEDVTRILRACPSERQTAMFSATFPDSIEAMSAKFQRDAVHVTMEEEEVELGAIRQLQLAVEPEEKFHALCFLLSEFPAESALVFCNFKKTVSALTEDLAGAGLSVDRFDGDLDQFHRDQVLARFRNQSIRVLVATDVAGRGIDVEGLDLVVNFELPPQPEVYVHRIGRTGRAGKPGLALSLSSGPADPKTEAAEALTGTAIEFIDPEPFAASNLDSLLEKLRQAPRMETILISGGRKDKVRPGDIVGALTGDAGGLEGDQIGTIEVQDRLSYVAVAQAVARRAVKQLNAGRIKNKRFRATLVGGGGIPRSGS